MIEQYHLCPPDGAFDLMTYRLSTQVKPLIWVEAQIERHSRSRMEIMVDHLTLGLLLEIAMERRLSNINEWLYFSFAGTHEIKNKNVLVFLAGNETRDIKAKQGTYETYNILLE
ncbi:unnamed protein product [Lactuca virosa]|uniref:Uncharacterized protein n=1 Tax=Lactuca virosa TaxID=75947 RepID=A0AAU9MBP3_9ASTR|nr:unnamed protein product [Lactuca virosa]